MQRDHYLPLKVIRAHLEAIGRHRLKGNIPVGMIFYASLRVGRTVERIRRASA